MDASALLGTTTLPAGFKELRTLARMAKAYHLMQPYPQWGFNSWKTGTRGPIPRCLPHSHHIVTQQARALFGKPVHFKSEDKPAEEVNDIWDANNMGSKAVVMATMGGQSGSVALKWSYDEADERCPCKIQVLDALEHCRFYYDPFDPSRLLMARVQFPYYDNVANKTKWYREDWTDEKHVVYKPYENTGQALEPTALYANVREVDEYAQWEVDTSEANPFGVIPLWQLSNKAGLNPYGEGDLWGLFHVVDLANFTFDLGNKDNQLGARPNKIYIDLKQEDEDPPQAEPSLVESLKSEDGKDGRVELLETSGAIREHIRKDFDCLVEMLYEAAGGVLMRPDQITNKGNLTAATLKLVYSPLLSTIEEKRKAYGEDGLSMFVQRMTQGLAKVGAKGIKPLDDVQVAWADIFDLTSEDMMAEAERQAFMVEQGFTTRKRAAQSMAVLEGETDVDELVTQALGEYDAAIAAQAAQAPPAGGKKAEDNNGDKTRKRDRAGA